MTRIFAMIALGQLPQPVVDEALRGIGAGGFQAAMWIALGGWTVTALAAWRILAQRDKLYADERAANGRALDAAQSQAVTVATVVTKIEGTLARVADALEQMKHRIEDLQP